MTNTRFSDNPSISYMKLRYKTTAKTVYDQPGSTLDQKDRDH